jgi:hypothetical protein
MHQADITTLGDSSFLGLFVATYSISGIGAKMITAINERPLCVRETLVIDRQARSVSLIRTKKSKAEHCSLVQDEPLTISLTEPNGRRR